MNIYLAELIGTALIIVFGAGVVSNVVLGKSNGKDSGWIVITTGWALGVMIAIYTVGWVSGAHLNPAVTIALASIGAFNWSLVPLYIVSQLLGAIIGSTIVFLIYKRQFDEETNQNLLLGIFCTAPTIRDYKWNFITEVLATFIFVFCILGIGNLNNTAVIFSLSNGETITGNINILGALLVGFLVWAMGLSLGGPTGYAINPARDLGPRIAHFLLPIKHKGGSDWGYSWIPVIAPIIGGVLGAKCYVLFFS